jgi:hypothetical protein
VSDEIDPNSSDYLVRVAPDAPPPQLPLLVSDVLCSLRPSLDYLVYALAILDSGSPQVGTQFPICDTPENFANQKNRLTGLSNAHQAAIEGLQPYPGRQNVRWLAILRDLSNPDKHRHLHTTVSIVQGEFALVGKPRLAYQTVTHRGEISPVMLPILQTQPPDEPGAEVNVQLGLTVSVAFDDRSAVVETLEILHAETRALIDSFKPEFQLRLRTLRHRLRPMPFLKLGA